jgi:NitT/TauT family transport system permease protein
MKHTPLPLAFTAVVALAWEAMARTRLVNPIVLPAPSAVVSAGIANAPRLLENTAITMLEALLGFALATFGALALAIAFLYSRPVRETLYPYAIVLKSTPIIALAPFIVLWAGNGMLSKVVMAAMVAFFPVLVNAVQGLAALDDEILDLARSVDASRWTVLWRLRAPASLPAVFSGLRVASTLAVVGAVIGEFTGAKRGVGHLITVSSYYLDTPLMFAAITCTALAGLAFFGLVALAERRVVFWRKPAWA